MALTAHLWLFSDVICSFIDHIRGRATAPVQHPLLSLPWPHRLSQQPGSRPGPVGGQHERDRCGSGGRHGNRQTSGGVKGDASLQTHVNTYGWNHIGLCGEWLNGIVHPKMKIVISCSHSCRWTPMKIYCNPRNFSPSIVSLFAQNSDGSKERDCKINPKEISGLIQTFWSDPITL